MDGEGDGAGAGDGAATVEVNALLDATGMTPEAAAAEAATLVAAGRAWHILSPTSSTRILDPHFLTLPSTSSTRIWTLVYFVK